MIDRELLELAAKAAGLEERYTKWKDRITDYDSPHYGEAALHSPEFGGQADSWNPLTDDGDVLRLAVKLGLYFSAMDHSAIASHDEPRVYEQVPFDGDRHAATRRAIVQAAAEIVRQQ